MLRKVFTYLPLALAVYAISVFATASTLTQLASASSKQDGVWVQLCASGARVFLTLGDDKDDTPQPTKTHFQACHACGDDRRTLKTKNNTPD